jgi:hypothetical protein
MKIMVSDETAAWLRSRASRYGGDVQAAAAGEIEVARALADSSDVALRQALSVTEAGLRKLADM